jgi:hypothetical protein
VVTVALFFGSVKSICLSVGVSEQVVLLLVWQRVMGVARRMASLRARRRDCMSWVAWVFDLVLWVRFLKLGRVRDARIVIRDRVMSNSSREKPVVLGMVGSVSFIVHFFEKKVFEKKAPLTRRLRRRPLPQGER